MKNNTNQILKFSFLIAIGLLFFIFVYPQQTINPFKNSTTSSVNTVQIHEKQKGAHVFGNIDTGDIEFLTRNNIEWVTLVSWGFQDYCNSRDVRHHNGDSVMIQQSDSGWVSRMKLIRSAGFKIFLKPHVWISKPDSGKWRSDVFPENNQGWETWKTSYRNFVLRYAKLAQQAEVEMFCVGTEFTLLTLEKTDFWKALIRDVRQIYSGKLTYAANWYKEFEKIKFWKELDYIGIQAYFPLVKNKNPSIRQISRGWNKYLPLLKSISKKYNRKILFTELGYKSTSDSAISPWEWIENPYNDEKIYSTTTQSYCYQAFFNKIWSKDWFAGVHIWSIRSDIKNSKRKKNLDFTPLGKPAEQVIANGFK
jgi:hypothetical protein